MQITITSRAWVVAGLMGLSLLGGLITGQPIFSDMAWMFMGLLLVGLVWTVTSLWGVRVSRRVRSRRSQVGRIFEERLIVRNTNWVPKLWVELFDDSDLPNHQVTQVVSRLGAGVQFSWAVRTLCVRRGRFQLGPAMLQGGDPFGLFLATRQLPAVTNVVVYPPVFAIDGFVTPLGTAPGGEALRRRTPFMTPNAAGVRDYQVGDSLSRIHWRSSARRDRLMVKEFELDPLGDVWVVLDGFERDHVRPLAAEVDFLAQQEAFWTRDTLVKLPGDTESYTVAAAASLVQFFVRRDRPVGLIAFGNVRESIAPDAGERQLLRILETLAVWRAEGELPLNDLLGIELHNFSRGATVVIVTPSEEKRWLIAADTLRRRGLKVAVVVVDRTSFGGSRNVTAGATYGSVQMPVYVLREGEDVGRVLSLPFGRG